MFGQESGMTEEQQRIYLSTLAARLEDALQLEGDVEKLEKVSEIVSQLKEDAEKLN